MAIVATEIVHIDGTALRSVYYRCQDHLGQWHPYGPLFTSDPLFDIEAHKAVVAVKVANSLAVDEFDGMVN